MTRLAAFLATTLALSLATGAAAVGPGLPDVQGIVAGTGGTTYTTAAHGATTQVTRRVDGEIVDRVTIAGAWGIPLVTLNTATRGGLSTNGRVLVLGDNTAPAFALRPRSRFAVLDTRSLALVRTITLHGDYSFDALSPSGRWLYLIHHIGNVDFHYRVKAYDLQAGKLLPGVIADRSQKTWVMAGLPMSRATSASGRWVYTLYSQSDSYPFVHALDTVSRTAICIRLPWKRSESSVGVDASKLRLSGQALDVPVGDELYRIDTRTFRVTES